MMNDPDIGGVLAEPFDFVMRKIKENGTTFIILSEPLSTTPVTMYFWKNSYLTKVLSDLIQNMIASGLVEYWIKNELRNEAQAANNDEPRPMTLRDLSAPFFLCCAGLLISFLVFVLELIFHHYKMTKRIDLEREFGEYIEPTISFKF